MSLSEEIRAEVERCNDPIRSTGSPLFWRVSKYMVNTLYRAEAHRYGLWTNVVGFDRLHFAEIFEQDSDCADETVRAIGVTPRSLLNGDIIVDVELYDEESEVLTLSAKVNSESEFARFRREFHLLVKQSVVRFVAYRRLNYLDFLDKHYCRNLQPEKATDPQPQGPTNYAPGRWPTGGWGCAVVSGRR